MSMFRYIFGAFSVFAAAMGAELAIKGHDWESATYWALWGIGFIVLWVGDSICAAIKDKE